MRTFKVTVTYEVEIVDDPYDMFTTHHIASAVYQSQAGDVKGVTLAKPPMPYLVTETSIAFEELDC